MQLNGRLRYITAETVRQCPWYRCLYGVPAAALTDLGIIAADTLLVPVDVFWRSPYDDKQESPLLWLFWLPFYPLVCAVSPFGYQEQPDNGALYRWLWGFNYLDSANGTLQLHEVADPLGRKTRIICNQQPVGEVYGRIKLLASTQNQLVAATQEKLVVSSREQPVAAPQTERLYWWVRQDVGWQLKAQEYVPGSDALLEFSRNNRQHPEEYWYKVSDQTWQLLQELSGQTPVEQRLGRVLQFSTGEELFYELHLTYPAGSIWVGGKIIPGADKPQIYYVHTTRMDRAW